MAIRSTLVASIRTVVAISGVPIVALLFLGVLGYCYLEWVHDTLASRLSEPTGPMRTVEASP